jgi:biotin carboxyl carrier protein
VTIDDGTQFRTLVVDETVYKTRLSAKYARRKQTGPPDRDAVRAVIPGTVLTIDVKQGQRVKRGDRLAVLEAMKMKNPILAPREGRVESVSIQTGEVVVKNQELFRLNSAPFR